MKFLILRAEARCAENSRCRFAEYGPVLPEMVVEYLKTLEKIDEAEAVR